MHNNLLGSIAIVVLIAIYAILRHFIVRRQSLKAMPVPSSRFGMSEAMSGMVIPSAGLLLAGALLGLLKSIGLISQLGGLQLILLILISGFLSTTGKLNMSLAIETGRMGGKEAKKRLLWTGLLVMPILTAAMIVFSSWLIAVFPA